MKQLFIFIFSLFFCGLLYGQGSSPIQPINNAVAFSIGGATKGLTIARDTVVRAGDSAYAFISLKKAGDSIFLYAFDKQVSRWWQRIGGGAGGSGDGGIVDTFYLQNGAAPGVRLAHQVSPNIVEIWRINGGSGIRLDSTGGRVTINVDTSFAPTDTTNLSNRINDKVDSVTVVSDVDFDWLYEWKNGVSTLRNVFERTVVDGLIKGGIVTNRPNTLIEDVTAATYRIGGITYTSPLAALTLATADATNPRVDVVAVNTSGQAVIITGTPGVNPVTPQVDPATQLYLTSIPVPAGATSLPNVFTGIVFNENLGTPTEWTASTSGTASVNFGSTAQAFDGTKSAAVASASAGAALLFTNGSAISLAGYTTFSFRLRLTANLTNAQNMSVQFYNGTTAISSQVTASITKNSINTWQTVAFNMGQFTFTGGSMADRVRITLTGAYTAPFYVDYIAFQGGITQPPTAGQYMSTMYKRGDSVFYNKGNVEYFAYKDSIGTGGSGDSYFTKNSTTLYPTERENLLLGDTLTTADAPLKFALKGGSVTHSIWQPRNYLTAYGAAGKARRYSSGWDVYEGVNDDGRPNVVFWDGYNAAPGGGRLDTSDAGLQFRRETHYQIFGSPYFEMHMPEVYARDGNWYRPFSMYINKASGTTFIDHVNVNKVQWTRRDNSGWASLQTTNSILNPVFSLSDSSVREGNSAIQLGKNDNSGGFFSIANYNDNTIIEKTGLSGSPSISTITHRTNSHLFQNRTSVNEMLLDSTGSLRLHKYGLGNKTGTAEYNLGVDASGNVIEVSATGGSGANFYTNDDALTSNRTVSLATKSLTIKGAFYDANDADSTTLILENISGANSPVSIDLRNRYSGAKRWQIRSLQDGSLDFLNRTDAIGNLSLHKSGVSLFRGAVYNSNYVSDVAIAAKGTIVTQANGGGSGGLVIQGGTSINGTVGIEMQALGTENYIDAYSRVSGLFLNMNYRATLHKFSNGPVLINTTSDDGVNKLQVNGNAKAAQYRLSALNTAPTSATATGTLGEIRVTADYIYVCTATNTWVRAALSTW